LALNSNHSLTQNNGSYEGGDRYYCSEYDMMSCDTSDNVQN